MSRLREIFLYFVAGLGGLAIACLLVIPFAAFADYTVVTDTGSNTLGAIGKAGDGTGKEQAQTFKTIGAGTLSSIDMSLWTSGSPGDEITIDINGPGSVPGGTNLYSTTVKPISGSCTTFTIHPSVAVSATSVYWIYAHRTGSTDDGNYWRPCGSYSSSYTDGDQWSLENGGSWGITGEAWTTMESITEGGGGGGGSGTTTPWVYTATTTVIDNPTQDFANGLILFMIGFGFMVWLFVKFRECNNMIKILKIDGWIFTDKDEVEKLLSEGWVSLGITQDWPNQDVKIYLYKKI